MSNIEHYDLHKLALNLVKTCQLFGSDTSLALYGDSFLYAPTSMPKLPKGAKIVYLAHRKKTKALIYQDLLILYKGMQNKPEGPRIPSSLGRCQRIIEASYDESN